MAHSETYIKANKAYINEDYHVALTLFNQELALNAQNELAYLGKAKSLIKIGKPQEGIAAFEPCLALLDPNDIDTYLAGFRGFLLKNNLTEEATQFLFDHVVYLDLKNRVDLLLGLALQKNDSRAIDFIKLNGLKANLAIINNIGSNGAISEPIKEICDGFYDQYILEEKRILLTRFDDNQSFINQLDDKYTALKNDYENRKERINEDSEDLGLALRNIKEAHNFFKNDLHQSLESVKQDEISNKISTLIEEHRETVDLFKSKSVFLKKAVDFAKRNNIIKIASNKTANTLLDKMSVIIDVLRSKNYEKTEKKLRELPETVAEITACSDDVASVLIKQYDHLLRQKQNRKALKIGRFLYHNLDQNDHYLSAQRKFNKKVKALIIVSVLSAILITIGAFFANKLYQENKYQEAEKKAFNRAINEATHSQYQFYLTGYPNTENAPKIKELDELLLYDQAVKSNNKSDFQLLHETYPKSDYLASIGFYRVGSTSANLETVEGDNLTADIGRFYHVPKGARLKYSTYGEGKLPKNNYFTAVEDLQIYPELSPDKSLIFQENFQSNANHWDLRENIKQGIFNSRVQSIKMENGQLILKHNQGGNNFLFDMIRTPITSNEDFEIEISAHEEYYDNGFYILFGSSKRAFNYIQISSTSYKIGHNNWDNANDNWISYTGGWRSNQSINNGRSNLIRIVKTGDKLKFSANGSYLDEFELKKWYGNRIGFGVPSGTTATVDYIKIYKLGTVKPPDYKAGQVYFCNVEELNLRSEGSKKSDIITTIKAGTPVKYLGEKTVKTSEAKLYDQRITDCYYKFELVDGTTGWMHGGALCELEINNKIPFSTYVKYAENK